MSSRGNAISGYSPAFAKGALVYSSNFKAAFLSGTISALLSGVVAVAHGLGVKPKFVTVGMKATHANIVAGQDLHVSYASAATATSIYIKSQKTGNTAYVAYVQI